MSYLTEWRPGYGLLKAEDRAGGGLASHLVARTRGSTSRRFDAGSREMSL